MSDHVDRNTANGETLVPRADSRSIGHGSVDKLLRPLGYRRATRRNPHGLQRQASIDAGLVPIGGGDAQLRRRIRNLNREAADE